MKNNAFFIDIVDIYKKYNCKLNDFIKNNIWITPLIYIIGTVVLLARNKINGLQFSTISLSQFALITAYLFFFLTMFGYTKYEIGLIIKLFMCHKEKKKQIIMLSIIKIVVYLILIVVVFYILTDDILSSIEISFLSFVLYPIFVILFNNDKEISYMITINMFVMLILFIPISLGGFKGQNVIYHDYNENKDIEYVYYGNYEDLYQFKSENDVVLIPIQSGYIRYKK